MNTVIISNEGSGLNSQTMDVNSYYKIYGNKNSIVRFSVRELESYNRLNFLSIHCAFKGNEFYKTKNCTYRVSNSKYLILNERTERVSFISSLNQVESFSIIFTPQFVENNLSSFFENRTELNNSFYTSPKNFLFSEQLYDFDDLISNQVLKIKHQLDGLNLKQNQIDDMIQSLFEAIVCKQRAVWEEIQKVPCTKLSTKKELYERLTRAKDFVFSCYKENISIGDLADLSCLNQDYFSREFKRVFGFRPLEYIQNLRLTEGKRLLSTTTKTTNEICYEVGYSDPSSFCKLFKKRYNCYPQEYRKAEIRQRSEELVLH